jgi:hypothetical protein
VFDTSGRSVQELDFDVLLPGEHIYTWDAEGNPSGLYFVLARTEGGETVSQKVLLLQ